MRDMRNVQRQAWAEAPAVLRERVAELERERELLNAIANYAPSLICLVDGDGRVRPFASNRAFEQVLGYGPHETGGDLFWEKYVADGERGRARGPRPLGDPLARLERARGRGGSSATGPRSTSSGPARRCPRSRAVRST